VGFLIAIITVALLAVVIVVVSAPLRRARRSGNTGVLDAPALAAADDGAAPASVSARSDVEASRASPEAHDEFEAAREAKYREIRDAELDFRTGKLSREDYQVIDADLRAEAIEILDQLEALRPRDA
jgi:hypothetical protein